MSDDKPQGEIILYQTDDGMARVECRFANGSVWLTQKLMSDLFQVGVNTINYHLKEIYAEGEVDAEATIRNYRIVRFEGNREVSRQVDHYNLNVILAVGYRVRSSRGTAFRQWATARLSEYLVKGFTLDDKRLKEPPGPGVPDYFDEMLERIRDIRSAERRMYLQVRNILALAADYEPNDAESHRFFQVVQNKLHFAATGLTAPELIAERANHEAPNMGLTAWKGDIVRKGDVTIAKNYLAESEIGELNRIVVMFLDFAEDQARRRRQVFMRDWREKLDDFLRFNDRNVLSGGGRVSRESADRQAVEQYELFHQRRLAATDAKAEAETIQALAELAAQIPKKRGGKGSEAPRARRKS